MSEEIKKLNASVAPEEFDWDAFENEGVDKGSKEETLAKYEQTLSKVTENEVVEGVVTSINKREVVVNIGAKSEGVISAPEFRYNPDLKVGDKVEVLVESAEDRKGQLVWRVCISIGYETTIDSNGNKKRRRNKVQRMAYGTLADARKLCKQL